MTPGEWGKLTAYIVMMVIVIFIFEVIKYNIK